MERGGKVGNVLDSRHGVGNGVDRGRAGVVDDDRGILVQKPKQLEHYSTCIKTQNNNHS